MQCDLYRTAISAQLDGEPPPVAAARLDAHLAECQNCRAFEQRASDLGRVLRVREADAVPDQTAAILAAAAPRLSAWHEWVRYALAGVGLVYLALAVPTLVAPGAEAAHTTREAAAWGVALGIGLLVVAWQPQRARGLLPLGVAIGAVMVLTAAIDVAEGTAAVAEESTHVVELVAVGLLWIAARQSGSPRQERLLQPA